MKSGFLSLLHLLALGLVDLLDKIIDECDDQHVGDVVLGFTSAEFQEPRDPG